MLFENPGNRRQRSCSAGNCWCATVPPPDKGHWSERSWHTVSDYVMCIGLMGGTHTNPPPELATLLLLISRQVLAMNNINLLCIIDVLIYPCPVQWVQAPKGSIEWGTVQWDTLPLLKSSMKSRPQATIDLIWSSRSARATPWGCGPSSKPAHENGSVVTPLLTWSCWVLGSPAQI